VYCRSNGYWIGEGEKDEMILTEQGEGGGDRSGNEADESLSMNVSLLISS